MNQIVPNYEIKAGLRVYLEEMADLFKKYGEPAKEVEVEILSGKFKFPSKEMNGRKWEIVEKMKRKAQEKGRKFFLGKMWACRGAYVTPSRGLHIVIQECDYGDHVSSNRNLDDPVVQGTLKKYGWNALANIVGTNNLCVIGDNDYCLLGIRSEVLGFFPSEEGNPCYGTVGSGCWNPEKDKDNPKNTIRREMSEETGIPQECIKDKNIEIWFVDKCLYDLHTELGSIVDLSDEISQREVVEYLRNAEGRWEHEEILLVPSEAVGWFLSRTRKRIPKWCPQLLLGDYVPEKTVSWVDAQWYVTYIWGSKKYGEEKLQKKIEEATYSWIKPSGVIEIKKNGAIEKW